MANPRRLLSRLARPPLLASLLACLLLAGLLSGCGIGGLIDQATGGATDLGPPPVSGGGSAAAMSDGERAFADEVLRLVNVERANAQLAPLAWEEDIAVVAYGHSVDMDLRGFFSHTNPSGQGPGERLIAAGVTGYRGWGENIARGQRTPAAVMATWMGSQGHRDNILRASFTHVGVGVHAPGDIWWTQLFLTR